ncbi:MAG: hypothetical protein LBU40_05655 [Methanobrevibacter sp.]|nr:hypothetical protein [Methanobrevibacter sp.]
MNDNNTDFQSNEKTKSVIQKINDCVKKSVAEIMVDENNVNKKEIIISNRNVIGNMSNIDKDSVGKFITKVQRECPTIRPKDLEATSKIFINMKNSESGFDLLHKISSMDPDDIDSLNDILEEWDIKKAKVVLSLISKRLDLIETLELKMDDPKTDELHELQILFESGLWIFGPEYESAEYTSNNSLSTASKKIFKKKKVKLENPRLRPDFLVLPDSSIALHSIDDYDDEGEPGEIKKLLIIELKKGNFAITRKETGQVGDYIEELLDGGIIPESIKIDAYVLGSKIVKARKKTIGDNSDKKIIPMTYHRILNKAEKRLFNLRDKIKKSKNIDDDYEDDIIKEVMNQKDLSDF